MEDRLAALDATVSRQRWMMLVLLCLGVAIWATLLLRGPGDVARLRTLTLVDGDGKVVAVLSGAAGHGELAFLDGFGKQRLLLRAPTTEEPEISLRDAGGTIRMQLQPDQLLMAGTTGKTQIQAATYGDGRAQVRVEGRESDAGRIALVAVKQGATMLALAHGLKRGTLCGVSETGFPLFEQRDRAGRGRLRAFVGRGDLPQFAIYDADDMAKVQAGVESDGVPVLRTFAGPDKIGWQAGR